MTKLDFKAFYDERVRVVAFTLADHFGWTDFDDQLALKVLKAADDVPFPNILPDQQPLGEEFSKILHDNLWELYEKEEND